MTTESVAIGHHPLPPTPPLASLGTDLKRLREAVAAGECRIGPHNAAGLPCLVGLIMLMLTNGQRDAVVEAIADAMPADIRRFERPQARIMRYCRSEGTSRRQLLGIIDLAIRHTSPPSLFDVVKAGFGIPTGHHRLQH